MNGSKYVNVPLRFSAILKYENDEKYCSLWSIVAGQHLCENIQPEKVTNCRQYL